MWEDETETETKTKTETKTETDIKVIWKPDNSDDDRIDYGRKDIAGVCSLTWSSTDSVYSDITEVYQKKRNWELVGFWR